MLNKKYKKVIFLSFPRSGHHLLTNIIQEIYDTVTETKDNYCEFYNCCKTFPCKHNKIFCKNHDFTLDLPINPEYIYIIQYRLSPYAQLQAYYDFDIKVEKYGFKGSLNQFIKSKQKYYIGWIQKWIENNNKFNNLFYISYEGLLENPTEIIVNLCDLLFDCSHLKNKIFDQNFIENIVKKYDICVKNVRNIISQEEFKKCLNIDEIKEKINDKIF